MAEIKPFKGVLYNSAKMGGDYPSVCAPPYDVISPAMRDKLYDKNGYNIVRLILGRSYPSDNAGENRYIRAGRLLNEWMRQGVLIKDNSDAFYVYVQEYTSDDRKCRRTGFIGLMKIMDPDEKRIFPHERTHAGPKEDRMNLIKEVRANLSPVFGLYPDRDRGVTAILEDAVSSAAPAIDIREGRETHALWRLRDRDLSEKISRLMEDRKIFIADGHHRYEVARKYRDMMRKGAGYNGGADFVMMYFTDMTSPDDLTVMATHRVIKDTGTMDDDEVLRRLEEYFRVTERVDLRELMKSLKERSASGHVFGFFGKGKYFLMEMKNERDIEKLIVDERSAEWKRLGVSILHSAVLREMLGVKSEEGNVTYVKDPEEAVSLVRDGSHRCAFFLNPTRVDQLKAVAESGDMMPQKSTYFYPKLLSGLVMNKFDRSVS